MEGVHLNIHCTRVYIKKYATYLSSCMVPGIISLVAKKVRYAYEYIYVACLNSQQRLMPPFTSDLQMALLCLDEIMNFANCVWAKIGLSDTHTLLNSSMCMCLFHIIDP